jgi:heptosyltransferase I
MPRPIRGATEHPLRWDLPLAADAQEYAAQHTDKVRPTVVISPYSSQRSRNFRNWSVDNYKAVIRHLQEHHHCRILLTGGNSDLEKEYGQALCENAAPDLEYLIGQSSLPELAVLISAADLVICPNSGPAHIGTAVGTA